MVKTSIWQEADCPNGADWDLTGDEMVYAGQLVPCLYCDQSHDASIVETYVVDANGDMHVQELPANAEVLAALRAAFEVPPHPRRDA